MMKYALAVALALVCLARPAQADFSKALNVQSIRTPAGINLWLVEDKTVPVIAMNFSFMGGLAHDPEDKPGVGRMVSILLDEGADSLKSQDFQAQLSDNAIALRFTAERDAFTGQLKTLKTNKDLAFSLLRMALMKPRFDADAIERMRNANLSEIKENMGDPRWLVARTFNGMVFDKHPYSIPGFGTLESIPKITRKDLMTFVHGQFARDVLAVSVVGDISAEEATQAVDTIFASLPGHAEETNVPEAVLQSVGRTILLPLDTPQTYISVGEAGIKRSDKDWHAASIMNYILGGGSFDARLMQEIRKKRGLTYGVYTKLNSMKHTAVIQADMSASNEKVAEALDVLRQEWARMAKDGPTDQEVMDAKSYLTGSLPLALTSTDDIAEILNDFQREGLDYNYINQHNAELSAVSVADVKRVAAHLLKPENLTVVLVGQPTDVTADIMLDHAPGMAPPAQKQ